VRRPAAALWFAGLAAVTFAAYRGALDNPFVYDDHHAILENEFIQDARHLGRFLAGEVASTGAFRGHFRPIPMASLALSFAAGGLDPWGYRFANLVLHFACALLVYFVVRRLLFAFAFGPRFRLSEAEARIAALVAASLFAVHPVHSLAVLMVWKRTTLFAALFFLAALWSFLKLRGLGGEAPRGMLGRAAAAAGVLQGFAGGLASKETAITLPAAILLLEIWPRPGAPAWDRRRLAGVALLQAPLWVGVALSLTVFFPDPVAQSAAADPWRYLLTQAKVIWLYVGMVFAPNLLAAAYDVGVARSLADPAVIAGGAGLLALLAGSIVLARRYPFPTLAVVLALLTLSPTSSFVPGPLLVDEDRTYLPFIAIWALFGGAAAWAWRGGRARRLAAAAMATLAIGGSALATAARCITWSDDVWVWLDALEKYPEAQAAHTNLCAALSGKPGHARAAVAACRRAVEAGPDSTVAASALVRSLAALGRFREARAVVDRGLARRPGDPHLLKVAGHLAWASDEPDRAIPYYLRALRQNPWDVEALLYFAKSHQEVGREAEARRALRYIEGRPILDAAARATLADLYRELGDLDRAERILETLRREGPAEATPVLGLALLALSRGDRSRAGALLAEAERKSGDWPSLHLRIARAHRERGAPAEAARILRHLLAARPAASVARAELALAELSLGRRKEACGEYARVGEARRERAVARIAGPLEAACGRR
jgi:tetratricopeptide (TPR) repeat protein